MLKAHKETEELAWTVRATVKTAREGLEADNKMLTLLQDAMRVLYVSENSAHMKVAKKAWENICEYVGLVIDNAGESSPWKVGNRIYCVGYNSRSLFNGKELLVWRDDPIYGKSIYRFAVNTPDDLKEHAECTIPKMLGDNQHNLEGLPSANTDEEWQHVFDSIQSAHNAICNITQPIRDMIDFNMITSPNIANSQGRR